MIHLLMYANKVNIKGLVSTSFVRGRKTDILKMIDLYEQDYPLLSKHEKGFPLASSLKSLCKQGAIEGAPFKVYADATEGSNWLIHCAKNNLKAPLWVLVWGGLEDVAQALHDAPEIRNNIRVFWIGGPNKKWGINAYSYIAKNFPDLWFIESNATYRGWFIDTEAPDYLKAPFYFKTVIKNHGKMGEDFINYYNGNIKMGDTPSLAYLLNGNPDNPTDESWGGSYISINRSTRNLFIRNSNLLDTVPCYSTIEWQFKGPNLKLDIDSVFFNLEISGQQWPGYYIGDGIYSVRYSSKQPEVVNYVTRSKMPELDNIKGSFVSVIPWPGKSTINDYKLGDKWYSDKPNTELFLGNQQGAKSISKYRAAFLMDWAKRWAWLN